MPISTLPFCHCSLRLSNTSSVCYSTKVCMIWPCCTKMPLNPNQPTNQQFAIIHLQHFSTTPCNNVKKCITHILPVQSRVGHNPCSMHRALNQTVFVWLGRWNRSWEFQPRRVWLPVTLCIHEVATPLRDLNDLHCLHDQSDGAVFRHLCTSVTATNVSVKEHSYHSSHHTSNDLISSRLIEAPISAIPTIFTGLRQASNMLACTPGGLRTDKMRSAEMRSNKVRSNEQFWATFSTRFGVVGLLFHKWEEYKESKT